MTLEFPAISLARYAARIGYADCAFFGVHDPDDDVRSCRAIWTAPERAMIAWALGEAQEELEQELRYFLRPKWTREERTDWRPIMQTVWGYVLEGGVISDIKVGDSIAVNYATDPATVTFNTTCAADDLRVFHEDTDTEIVPTSVAVVAGVATIRIPLCRLVDPAYEDNPDGGWEPSASATWRAAEVDVRCITNDPSTQAHIVWRVSDTGLCCTPGCTDHQHDGCLYVRRSEIGTVDVHRATYSEGVWTASACVCNCCTPDWAELYYYSGLTTLSKQAEDAIIRLAHSKMPSEPCGCQSTQRLWQRDRYTPDVLTRERINNPFGLSDGAWWAWRQAQSMKLIRGAVL